MEGHWTYALPELFAICVLLIVLIVGTVQHRKRRKFHKQDMIRMHNNLSGNTTPDDVILMQSGYAGILPNGNIVDRRKHNNAQPMMENELFGIPKPKKI